MFNLLEKGVNFEEEISKLSIDSRVDTKGRAARDNTDTGVRRDNRMREESGKPSFTPKDRD